jgi:signal transduction histidine kinase
MKLNDNEIVFMMTLGTGGMVMLAVMVIVFIVIYQRRIFKKKTQIALMEMENQRAMMDAVLKTKELEQKRIAQELHDEIGSSVNAVKMSLIYMQLEESARIKLNEDLLMISKNVRRLSNELMPSVLDELGFQQALVHLVKRFQESSNCVFDINQHASDPFSMDKAMELSMYRIIQELINNIIKYAKATKVTISVMHNDRAIKIELSDNGSGFIPTDAYLSKTDSLGLKNILSRVQQINADISYELLEPSGTKVTLIVKKP